MSVDHVVDIGSRFGVNPGLYKAVGALLEIADSSAEKFFFQRQGR